MSNHASSARKTKMSNHDEEDLEALMRATGASPQVARQILAVANARAGIDARQLRAMYE